MLTRRLVLAAALLAAVPAAARADAPANDAPAGASTFAAFTAENGTPTEKQAIAILDGSTADAGVARCFGAKSFEHTVWYRVGAADGARQITITGTGGSGQSAAQPDLAAYVVDAASATPTSPQACDGGEVEGPATGGSNVTSDVGGAPELDVRLPAGKDLLVQVGRPADQATERVVLSEAEKAVPGAAPAGDVATTKAAKLKSGKAATVALGGATLSAEDPAQPACPASATVWRRYVATNDGTQVIRASGAAVSAVTAFVGAKPTADNAVACALRAGNAAIVVGAKAKRGQTVWVRLGTEDTGAATAKLTVTAPPKLALTLDALRHKLRVRVTGGSLKGVKISVQRRRGTKYVTVATASAASLQTGRTRALTLKRKGSLKAAGRYRYVVKATTAAKPGAAFALTRGVTLKRGR